MRLRPEVVLVPGGAFEQGTAVVESDKAELAVHGVRRSCSGVELPDQGSSVRLGQACARR